MGYEFLARIRRTSLLATAMGSLFAAVYASYATGIAFAAGALWSLANLSLLETIVRSVTGGAHDKRRAYLAHAPAPVAVGAEVFAQDDAEQPVGLVVLWPETRG